MRAALALTLLLLAGPDPHARQVQLMDAIEKAVVLPPGAHPLGDYARFYAFEPDGKVVGRYIVPPREGRAPDEMCTELLANGRARRIKCGPTPIWGGGARPGQRRWVADRRHMPIIFDGGCMQVNVLYDPRSGKVEQAFCNGFA